jgi:quercetin dioxygenase-like cupin family protein
MRKTAVLLASLILVATSSAAQAQDPIVVAPNMYKKLFENERVRVLEVTFNPGDSLLPHSHPDHHVYAASGGKLKISRPDGTSTDADLKTGDVLFIPAETHWAKNVGTTTIRLVVNELKEPRPAPKEETKTPEKKGGK